MLTEKRDETIKRYLSKVGKLEHNSRHFLSRYYIISYNENVSFKVRFSDHFNDSVLARGIDIDIVKTSVGFYSIRLVQTGISYTITEKLVLPYLRSILLLYPEINNTITSLRRATTIAVKTSTKALEKAATAEMRLKKRDEFTELVDEVYEENKVLRTKISELRGDLNNAKSQVEGAKTSVEVAKRKAAAKAKECEDIKNKMAQLKKLLDSI